MDDLKAVLRERGFRATPGRMRLLQLLARASKPLTVQEIGVRLRLHVVTLYRALSDLADAGLLLRGGGIDAAMQFSYPRNHHHHLVCSGCGYAEDCSRC